MKNNVLTFIFLTVAFVVNAQINTFPATGNVGIGTISPVGKLVISNVGLNGLEIDPVTGWNGGTNIISYNRSLSLYTPLQLVGSNFSFGTSSVASGMSILNNGNVGIGNVSPAYKLVVSNAGANGLEIDPVSGLNEGTNIISYNRNTAAYTPLQLVGSNFVFGTSAVANGISLLNNGNVGIGVSNPIHRLDVNGTTNFRGSLVLNNNTLYLTTGGDYLTGISASGYANLYARGELVLSSNGNNIGQSLLLQNNGVTALAVIPGGAIGIGTMSPTEKLSVNGNVRAKKVIVSQTGWPDYVFDPAYKLKTLSELAAFIQKHQHLPDMPSAKEVAEKGINVGDNQTLLLKKIEEMTLYMINMNNEIEKLKAENIKLKSK
jgi:hypothetical protein